MKQIICTQYYDSPCGQIILASVGNELCLCDWNDSPHATRNRSRLERMLHAELREQPSAVILLTKSQLDEYFAGERRTFTIPLRPLGTDFQQRVWNALLQIPYGETRSYKDIALSVDKPEGIRTVAQAIGANGISILIPCHRVISSNHRLTGYAGGLEAKRTLLKLEGIGTHGLFGNGKHGNTDLFGH